MIIGIQNNNRFFPTRGDPNRSSSASVFSFAIRRSYFLHFNVVYSLNGILDLRLIRPFVDFKAVHTLDIRKVHALLCN